MLNGENLGRSDGRRIGEKRNRENKLRLSRSEGPKQAKVAADLEN